MKTTTQCRVRNALIVVVLGGIWLLIDVLTKAYFNSGAFAEGSTIAGPFAGLFRFTLVHNTGAAWGIFGNATFALGVLSVVLVALLLIYLFVIEPRANCVMAVAISLICAGGIGNAIDRFTCGYVVDFIEFTFVEFPVFNIADIGVTCGCILLLICLIVPLLQRKDKGDGGE